MYIRCAVCQAATWIESLEPGVARLSVSCQQCEQEYSLLSAGELGVDPEEQYQRARQFAEYNGIDLPSAYSVMLGIMQLEDATSAREKRVRQTENVASFTDEAPEEELPYDEGFHLAVKEGLLTPEKAADRGNRKALAVRLSQRHGIPLEAAYDVADNRLSLVEARRRHASAESIPAPAAPPATRAHKVLLLGFAAIVVAAVGFQSWRTWNRTLERPQPVPQAAQPSEAELRERAAAIERARDPVQRAAATTEVKTDPKGRLLRISGPDPASVLIAFCNSGLDSGRYEPVELARPIPSLPGARLGIMSDGDELGTLQAIRITKDAKTRRWVAGDGRRPIRLADPPPFPPDHPRTPVRVD
jgi:hypothetical protein